MNQLTQDILNVFQNFRMPSTAIDEFDTGGREKLAERIDSFIVNNSPLKFSMLGFPMKSINTRDKVLGILPDLGEEVAIKNFQTFNEKIKVVYPKGVAFSIISDGYIFGDLLGVEDKVIAEYEEINIDLAKIGPISWYDMTDFFDKSLTMNSMREKVTAQFGITEEVLEQRILMDSNVNWLYRGMIRFMNEELSINTYPSSSQLQKAAKKMAREMMFRNEAYSKLIQVNFSDHIRLSMHPSTNNGTKYSFQLVPGIKASHSPWHAAIAIDSQGDMETIHKKDAFAQGYELVYKDNQPYYFTNQQ